VSVILTIDNTFVYIDGADLKTTRAIDNKCSYKIAGYFFSPAYKSRRWDGKEHLFKFTKTNGYHAPVGMLTDIVDVLNKKKVKYSVSFKTNLKHDKVDLEWNNEIQLRDYQNEAVKAMFDKPFPGRGVLKMPIRSGKTKTVAKIIQKIGRPSIFVVPSKWLLYQTINSVKECIPNVEVGQIGDSVYDPKFVTVATIQSLAKMAPIRGTKKRESRQAHPDYFGLMTRFDLGIFDECHHIRGQGDWHRVFLDLEARFKIGISATVFFDNTKEQEAGIIWLRGNCGPIKCDIPTSRLIKEGFLLPQHVKIYKVEEPNLQNSRYSATLKKRCITENQYRNKMIASLVEEHLPMKTIIIANEHNHIARICNELLELDIDFRTLTGRDKQSRRDSVVEDFVSGRFNVIIGNVLGEGVDIPEVECVINAEGGKDEKKTWQRQRNLTIVEGSDKVPVMIDFYDDTCSYFRRHSKARLKVYKSEPEFKTEILEWR
jgi:superfamily II DNA or RNA helicase